MMTDLLRIAPVAADSTTGVAAATDGACSGNPRTRWLRGHCCAFERWLGAGAGGRRQPKTTTNNRMELAAALAVLEELKPAPLHSRSAAAHRTGRYLIRLDWASGCGLRNGKGWRTASALRLLNKEPLGSPRSGPACRRALGPRARPQRPIPTTTVRNAIAVASPGGPQAWRPALRLPNPPKRCPVR